MPLTRLRSIPLAGLLSLCLACGLVSLAAAQDGGSRGRNREAAQSQSAQGPLPADSTTLHRLALPGRDLAFSATAGSVALPGDGGGEAEAALAYVAYSLAGSDPATRPVAFFFNGGPGSASAWLQLGAAGPWRIAMEGAAASPSAPPTLLPNAETWLDFADLVFIDPVGTGWSRLISRDDAARRRYFSVNGDANSVARAIRLILAKHGRLASPKYVVGESYGGIRGPKVVDALSSDEGVGVSGLILVSPLFDYREFSGSSLLRHAYLLPSLAAVARSTERPVARADLADVEAYAAGDYLADLLRGPADAQAQDRVSTRVAGMTGLDRALVARLAGKVTAETFRREFRRGEGLVAGRYDGSMSGLDPWPDSTFSSYGDASSDPVSAPMSAAMTELVTNRLAWRPDSLYRLMSGQVNRSWEWGGGFSPPESLSQLRSALARDPALKVLVTHGLFDLATPYFGSRLTLNQLPAAMQRRIAFTVHPGGHMFYSRQDGREALRREAQDIMR